jgi:hypothetical protein
VFANRYSGTALAVNVVGGAVPPLTVGALHATYGGWAIGVHSSMC